jgi:DNA primase
VIPDDVVDRVRHETDIVSIIGEFVKLKRVGNSYRGPCPFHHGKNPNFSVTDRGYNCFKCGESGDVFSFVQKHLGMDFVESVKWVGAKSGVEVREVSRRTEEKDQREPFWEVNAAAAEFFTIQLWDSREGKIARDYLASRQISRADADRFGLGYAPTDSAEMRDYLRTIGFDDERQLGAGLVLMKQDRPEVKGRFRGRLMFPIYDITGHVVGFGGRILRVGDPKYLNSSESEVFSKRNLLYGLNWAKQAIRKAERLVIVEGYFDVIRLMLAGINEVVAPLGTALTEQQAALIRKYTKNVYLLYDSDQAGLKATFRSGDALLAAGVSAQVISLPDGEDPDTFVNKNGSDGFERAARDAVDVFERRIQILERSGRFGDLTKKRAAIDKLTPTIRVTNDPILRDLYIARTAEVAGVTRETIERDLLTAPRERRAPRESGPPPQEPPGEDAPPIPVRQRERRVDRHALGIRAERELVRVLLHQRRFIDFAAERVGADHFADRVYRAIFAELTTHEHDAPADQIAAGLDEEATEVLQELMNENGGIDRAEESIEGSVNSLLSRELANRLSDIDRLLPLAAADEKDDLIREKKRLAAEMQSLGRPRWKKFNSGH